METLLALCKKADYEKVLSQPFTDLSEAFVDDRSLRAVAASLLYACPEEIKRDYPLSMLRVAYALSGVGDMAAYDEAMRQTKNTIAGMPDGVDKTRLMGEWTFISLFTHYPDFSRMLPVLEQAHAIIDGTSAVLAKTDPFLFGTVGMLGLFHNNPGGADAEARYIDRFVSLYSELTDGGGTGANILFRAELCYQRGDIEQAELLCYKAAYMAEFHEADTLWMGTMILLAQVHIFREDPDGFARALTVMGKASRLHPENNKLCQKQLEYGRSQLAISLQRCDLVADWIRDGDMKGTSRLLRSAAGYVQTGYFFVKKQYKQAIGMAQAWCEGPGWGLLVPAVMHMYTASAYVAEGNNGQAVKALEKAAELLLPDDMILLFATFHVLLGDVMDEYLLQSHPSVLAKIKPLQRRYKTGWGKVFTSLLTDAIPANITTREHEVARMAAEGMSNKEIAQALCITEHTVKSHLAGAFRKLGISRRSQLAALFKQ